MVNVTFCDIFVFGYNSASYKDKCHTFVTSQNIHLFFYCCYQ